MTHTVLSDTLLRAFVPLGHLLDQQLELVKQHGEIISLFPGKSLFQIGDNEPVYYFLLHGQLRFETLNGERTQLQSGEQSSYQPIAHQLPRQVDVQGVTDSQVLKIAAPFLEKLLGFGQTARCVLADIANDPAYENDYHWIKKLLESKLFYKVPPMNIRAILQEFTPVNVKQNEQVIQQGDVGSCCYLLKSGRAEVFIDGQGLDAVAELKAGDVFGEDALVNDKPRNASIVMKTDGVLLKLEKQSFYQLLQAPDVTVVTANNVLEFLNEGAKLIDVRTQEEFELGHHPAAVNIPLHLSYLKSALLDKTKQYIAYSSSQERARCAASLLAEKGFNVLVMQGGINSLDQQQWRLFNQPA